MEELSPQAGRVCRSAGGLVSGEGVHRVRGVTYGTFGRRADGVLYPEATQVAEDFERMAARGLNTVRVYSVPPQDVIDLAGQQGLRLIVGLDYDDWRMVEGSDRRATGRVLAAGLEAVERAMETCAGRPEVLAVSVGNEVPVDLVRLHGAQRVERTLERLMAEVRSADREMLTTYTNYPSTEFLDPGGQDIVTWNVFLEDRSAFARYLGHLLTLAGERPLVLTEFGLSAGIHGERAQAGTLAWQLEELAASGASGGTAFSWTDEWFVANERVDDWDFGVTRADRSPKPAAEVLTAWPMGPTLPVVDLRETSSGDPIPRVSVVVCAYNESRNIEPCIESVLASTYPDVELIVCDDGSSDDTAERASAYPIRLLRLDRGGLSAARNVGMRAATGDIVAYLDADAEATPQWVEQLVRGFESPRVAAVGGPNHPYEVAGFVERAVAACPGNPREVLVGDTRAEHIAGCNMAFRREALLAANGFDVAYRTAGDDVDLCWRLLDAGYEIGFAPTAAIQHHRRGTMRGYLRQQRGYGRAERMLQGPHRERFNRLGQARWRGFVYGGLSLPRRLLSPVVYHGPLGVEPFQPTHRRRGEEALATLLALLPMLLAVGALTVACGLVTSTVALVAAGLALVGVPVATVGLTAFVETRPPSAVRGKIRYRSLVAVLHLLQPCVRAWGRLRTRPLPVREPQATVWTGNRLTFIDDVARAAKLRRWQVRYGGATDPFDLVASRGLTRARINLAVVWDWTPEWNARCRPRASTCVAAAVALVVLALVLGPVPVVPGVVAVSVVVAADLVLSRRRLRSVVAEIAERSALLQVRPGAAAQVLPAGSASPVAS